MQGKIALEEHFAIPETLQDSAGFVPDEYWPELSARLLDIQDRRVREMDENGIDIMILSLNAPAVQAIGDTRRAIEIARRSNDFLAEQVALRPDRFQGLAALPLQDPEAASLELRRCIEDLGFQGALVNGFSERDDSENLYYDRPEYLDFWAECERLNKPFYLHPRNPLPADSNIYAGHAWLMGPTWAFAQETAVHALRLIGSGLFDRYSNLRIAIGHLGEGIPAMLWRIDNRNAWVKAPKAHACEHPVAEYFRKNFWITTSGNFRSQSLISAIMELGADRILFSTDWPFENADHAAQWFDTAPISEADRLKIGRDNACRLFNL